MAWEVGIREGIGVNHWVRGRDPRILEKGIVGLHEILPYPNNPIIFRNVR